MNMISSARDRRGLGRYEGLPLASSMYRKFSANPRRMLGRAAARPVDLWYASAASVETCRWFVVCRHCGGDELGVAVVALSLGWARGGGAVSAAASR
jgi:hypothetical protein